MRIRIRRRDRPSLTEYRLFIHASWLLLRTRYALDREPLARVLQRVRRSSAVAAPTRAGGASLQTVCRAVERAARYLPVNLTCLPQALAGHVLCARYGYTTDLRVGIRAGQPLVAHAWLEADHAVILGDLPDLAQYQVFADSGALAR